MASSRIRRTQEERSEETQVSLYEATTRLLLECGYTRLTTTQVAEAAGVSRGALTHHFSNKEDLVVRSVEYNLAKTTAELRSFVKDIGGRRRHTDEIVDYLWSMMAGGLFYVTMEFLPEARHNAVFRDRLMPAVRDFHDALDDVWYSVSETTGIDPSKVKTMMNATLCLIRGMVAQSILRKDQPYFTDMLDYWKAQLRRDIELQGFCRSGAISGTAG